MDTIAPETAGLSTERLGRLSDWLQQQVSSERVAGASVLVGSGGKPVFFEAAGMAEAETGKPFAEDTIVRIYSMTKAITTVAAMMLYEEGCFQLDDPVARYIPEFAGVRVWNGGDIGNTVAQDTPMTIKHLMTHTSGLTYGFMHTNVVDAMYREQDIEFTNPEENLESWARRLAEIPLICQPGSQWNYSVSTDLLGRLVEIWSGLSLRDFMLTRVFEPLAMVDTDFHVREGQAHRFAALYGSVSGQGLASIGQAGGDEKPTGFRLQEAVEGSRYLQPTQLYSGGGGLCSTIGDYGRFCQMLAGGGELDGQRLLGRKTLDFMRRNHLPDNRDMAAMGQPVWSETTYDGIGFGLGWAVVLDPVKAHTLTSVGEHHWGGAASTFFWVDAEEDLYVVFFTQFMPSSYYPLRRELRVRVYQSLI